MYSSEVTTAKKSLTHRNSNMAFICIIVNINKYKTACEKNIYI